MKLKKQSINKQSRKTKAGRPTQYSHNLAKEICSVISTSSKGLAELCKTHPHWPCRDTIYTWISEHEEFSDMYARAKKFQIEVLIDEILEIADDTMQDNIVTSKGNVIANNEWINRARLKIDTRKWLASKLAPRLYGDKIQNEHTGLNNQTIEVNISDVKSRLVEKLIKLSPEEIDSSSDN